MFFRAGLVVALTMAVGCDGGDGDSDSGSSGTASAGGSGSTSTTGGTSTTAVGSSSGGSTGGDVIGDGMFASVDCAGTRVEAMCGPADMTLEISGEFFAMQCFAADSRFEIVLVAPQVGDLFETNSEVAFICPDLPLDQGIRLRAMDHPGAIVVSEVEPDVAVKGEFASEDDLISGWFNVREQ